ncbi:RNA helicase [Ranunculus cassubicifolius]
MLEKVPTLSLHDRFNFCFAPVNIRDPKAMYYLLRFASSYGQNLPASITMGVPKESARNDTELLDLETKHQVLSMYLWLSLHFDKEKFPYFQRAATMATDIADLLGQSLINVSWEPESRNPCSKPPPDDDAHKRRTSIVKDLANNVNTREKAPWHQIMSSVGVFL